MTRPRPDPSLGRVLRRLRKERGLSQEDLAFSSGVMVSALSRVERGLSEPVWGHVQALARALDVSLGELGAAVEQEHSPLRPTSRAPHRMSKALDTAGRTRE
jgi:transcriptional regulator with XRE-family HTH domain